MRTLHNIITKPLTIALLIIAFTLPKAFSAKSDIPTLKKITKNGVTVEYLPHLESLAKQIHPWLCQKLKDNPFDYHRDYKNLEDNQDEIVKFIEQQLAFDKPSKSLKPSMNKVLHKFQNAGKLFPDFSYIQLWLKDDLKKYLDGGGQIPGYQYTPGPDGHNQLTMGKEFSTSNIKDSKPIEFRSPLMPVILKTNKSTEYLSEAKKTIESNIDNISKATFLPLSVLLKSISEMAVQEQSNPPMRLIRWFNSGTSGYLTWRILKDFVSEKTANIYLETINVEPYIKNKHIIQLVHWTGDKAPNAKLDQRQQYIKNARELFASYEMIELVKRHGSDTIQKVFTELRKLDPFDEEQIKSAPKTISGELVGKNIELIVKAIQNATGEDIRPRLLEYSKAKTTN
jgi:hypothetical protein